eukprot:1739062-Pleurochrysis_carterae.AAC.1
MVSPIGVKFDHSNMHVPIAACMCRPPQSEQIADRVHPFAEATTTACHSQVGYLTWFSSRIDALSAAASPTRPSGGPASSNFGKVLVAGHSTNLTGNSCPASWASSSIEKLPFWPYGASFPGVSRMRGSRSSLGNRMGARLGSEPS